MYQPTSPTCASFCLAALFLSCGAATADPQPPQEQAITSITLDQLMTVDVQRVEGASRFVQEVVNAPASVTVVTRDEIAQYGYRTFADLLRGVRGFYVSNDRNYSYLGIRGFARPGDYNTRVLVMIDGHRLNDNVYDQALIGTEFPLDLSLIERVEIIRGPGSSVYGTSALLGVINVVTRRGTEMPGTAVSADAGTLGTVGVGGSVGRTFKKGSDLLVSATAYRSAGQSQLFLPGLADSTPTQGISANADHDQSWDLFGRATGRRWSAELVWGRRIKELPTGAWDTALGDPRSKTDDQRGYLDLRYDNTWKATTLLWRGSYDRYHYDGVYAAQMEEGLDPDPIRDYSRGEWWTTEASLRRRLGRRHLVTGGTELRFNTRQDQGEYQPLAGIVYLDDRRSSSAWSLFIEDEIAVSSRVLLTVGFRHDDQDPYADAGSPRAALIVKPRAGSAFKVLYGEAFRAPNIYETFYFTPEGTKLRPERIRSFETVWEQYVSRRFRVSASAFRYQIKDLITQVEADTQDGLGFANMAKADADGVGIEAEGTFGAGIRGNASYTIARASGAGGQALSNAPRHDAQLRLTVPVARGFRAGIEGLLLSSRIAGSGRQSGAVRLLNVTLTQPRLFGWGSLNLSVRNLFDRRYDDPGANEHPDDLLPQEGRTVRLRLGWRF